MSHPLAVGVGSPHGDDRAGWLVIERLHELGVSKADARIVQSPTELCHLGSPQRPLLVCDAGRSDAAAGIIDVCTWPAQSLPVCRGGTHDVSLGDALSLSLHLGAIPSTVAIWIINGRDFRPLSEPSRAVIIAAAQLADHLWSEWHHA